MPDTQAEAPRHQDRVRDPQGADKNPLLVALGERVRTLRARRGMTRMSRPTSVIRATA